jgi:hypothetical protein
MQVRCVKTITSHNIWDYWHITVGKVYEVLLEIDGCYKIKNDMGCPSSYEKELFEVVEEKVMDYKYKIGDKVVASKYLNVGQEYDGGCLFQTEMKKDAEEIMEIAECFKNYKGDNRYRIKNSIWVWSESMLCIAEGAIEVMKIKAWKELYGKENEKYTIRTDGETIDVLLKEDLCEEVVSIWQVFKDIDRTLGILKYFGFEVEFQKSPLEQVKDEIEKRILNTTKLHDKFTRECYGLGYCSGRIHEGKLILQLIESIEKDNAIKE